MIATREHGLSILRAALGDPKAQFRERQWEAIDLIVNRRARVLLVERTGWGKSYVYFVATRLLRNYEAGPTIIISPLLALMRNQIDAATRLNLTATTINSTNQQSWATTMDQILADEIDVLLVSPERLANEQFVNEALMPISSRIGLLVVDEAHCISDWGHDFRPDYRRLVNVIRNAPPNMPVLGTTATANDRVIADVVDQLSDVRVLRGPLRRESLELQSLRLPDQAARLAWLAQHVPELPGTGIVYVLTRLDADHVAEWLNLNGIVARPYYSDVTGDGFDDANQYRQHLESLLLENRIKALVATSALGMGYDKPDLGFVVHFQAPSSIIAYYQQVGRAGRGIDKAICVLLAGSEDDDIHEFFRNKAFPEEAHVQQILQALEDSDGLSARDLEETVNLRKGLIDQALKFLSVESPSPTLKIGPKWSRTTVSYVLDRARISRLTKRKELEWQEIQEYIDAQDCLMQHLSRILDDPEAQPCGKCARCLGRLIVPDTYAHDLAVAATRFLRRSERSLECNKQGAAGGFSLSGLRTNLPPELRAETGRTLAQWGDSGWGRMVAAHKHAGRFGSELMDAAVELIRERWKPDPAPEWVTSVPSRRNPDLVPNLARGIAERLRLPYLPVVKKVKDNEPQKVQENRYHQCRNLDGAFEVEKPVPEGPVLLVDDVVDSAWTMTVVSALLRTSGSGPVWPFAMASTTHRE